MGQTLESFIAKWIAAGPAERANKDLFLAELCAMLDVPPPNPSTGDPERDTYVFERKVKRVHEDSDDTSGSIDLYKQDCFILEAKQASGEGTSKLGKAKRGTPAWNSLMNEAYGQALGYARGFDRPPPFIIVCDIGHCFDLYAAFDGSGNYHAFPNAQKSRLFFSDLEKHRDSLRALFVDPHQLDPSKHAAKVTREVASHLAKLAKTLEDDGHDPTLIAQFLMRCLFTMFAEDVGLLPDGIFTKALKDHWMSNPGAFPGGVESLWRTMNDGGELFGVVGKILRFNGGLFANPKALQLDKKALALLHEAAACNWSDVEPAIFGTLLERALDPKERHALGAHYTPRAYVERLVRPTIEEPLRADWEIVQAQVRRLVVAAENAKTPKAHKERIEEAKSAVREFHGKLCRTRVLDPACGSGNFLYVTLDVFKRLEGDVLKELEGLGEKQTLMHLQSVRVTPEQFHGIEVKRWAKEIAELVLWIGYLQWHFRLYGKSIPVPEPVLKDYKNIECRDAVLAWDGEPELVRDEKGKPVTRWDGETMKVNPVTGEQVPDESARVPVYKYKNPRKAEWPEADFVVGNPPFVGNKRMRLALGDGYVEALRTGFPDVPESSDLVMYWWHKAALLIRTGRVRQFGLITTNSITQGFNRRIVEMNLADPRGLTFAIPDHPWVDSKDGAQVRIAMTCMATNVISGRLDQIAYEKECADGERTVRFTTSIGRINPNLTIGINLSELSRLASNRGLSCPGVQLSGQGFVLSTSDLNGFSTDTRRALVRPYLTGRDLMQLRREQYVLDTFGLTEQDLRQRFPDAYQWLADRVRPERQQNPRASYASKWWLHSEPRAKFREALRGSQRFIATSRTARHRVFQYLPENCLPETKVLVIALDDARKFGVLCSRAHVVSVYLSR